MDTRIREAPETEVDRKGAEGRAGAFRLIGSGVITGAADDDPSAIGTHASAGAKYGLAFLWVAPVLLPMMYGVVYLSSKLGKVYGKGLFDAIRDRFPRYVLYPVLIGGDHRQRHRGGGPTWAESPPRSTFSSRRRSR